MLQVSVVDASAEERLNTLQWLQQSFEGQVEGIEYVPRISFRPVSISELKFHKNPDIIVVGPALAAGPADDLVHIKRTVADVPVVVVSNATNLTVATVEYLSRIGVADILMRDIQPQELVRRFVMLASKVSRKVSGKLVVVESAKGGVGATTVTAALGELLAEAGLRTLLVDLDSQRQALSRFVQARPFLNDSLQRILDGDRPASTDFVEQCAVQVWGDLPTLFCMPPVAEGKLDGTLNAKTTRTLISIFEALDASFDVLLIDASHSNGTLRRIVHRAADRVVFVTEADPASVFASFEKLKRIREEVSPDTTVTVVENRRRKGGGLSRSELQREFERVASVAAHEWLSVAIPACEASTRWPGSGLTAFSTGNSRMRRAYSHLGAALGFVAEPQALSVTQLSERCRTFVSSYRTRQKTGVSDSDDPAGRLVGAAKPQIDQPNRLPQLSWAHGVDQFVSPPT